MRDSNSLHAAVLLLRSGCSIRTFRGEETFPWVIGEVMTTVQNAPSASPPYDSAKDAVRFEPVKLNEPALQVKLYEALELGSTTYVLSDLTIWVPARRVRVIKVEVSERGRDTPSVSLSRVPTPMLSLSLSLSLYLSLSRVRCWQLVAVRGSNRLAGRPRYTIEKESMQQIRAEMPTSNDDWEVRI